MSGSGRDKNAVSKNDSSEEKIRKEIRVRLLNYEDSSDDIVKGASSSNQNQKIFGRSSNQQVIGPRSSQSSISIQLSQMMRRATFTFWYPGVDVDSYDFAAERKNANSKIIPSIVYLVKGSLGCGFLCIHEAWKFCGLWTSVIVAAILGLLVCYSYRVIGYSAQNMYERIRVPKMTYPQLAEAALAVGPLRCSAHICRRCRHIINIWIFLEIMGTLCVYEILMAKTLKISLEHLSPKLSSLNLGIRAYIVLLWIPLTLLSFIRKLRVWVILATLADLYIILCIALAIYHTTRDPQKIEKLPGWRDIYGLFKFTAVFSYAIDGSYTILPTENNMRKPRYFYIVTDFGVLITTLFVTGIGFIGYWCLGSKSVSPFTLHMADKTPYMVLQVILALFFGVAFTMHIYMPFEIMWHYATKKFQWVKKHPRGVAGMITLQVFLITCIALACPYIIEMLCFIGVFCSTWLVFIVPAVIESFIHWDERKHAARAMAWHIINIIYVLAGLLLFFGGLISLGQSLLSMNS